MNEQAAVVIGASGLIGSHLVEQILVDDNFRSVRILVRKKLELQHSKLEQQIVDFNDTNDYSNKFGKGDSIFCCIGTTQKKVKGDKAAYEKIDHDIPVNAAATGIKNNYKNFLIVSSVGADPSASNFYLQLKGRIENDLVKFPFKSISIFRPSMLLGKRKENRPAEKFGQKLMQALSFMLFGPLKKYHPIKAEHVASAMIAQSKQIKTGIHILGYTEMMALLR